MNQFSSQIDRIGTTHKDAQTRANRYIDATLYELLSQTKTLLAALHATIEGCGRCLGQHRIDHDTRTLTHRLSLAQNAVQLVALGIYAQVTIASACTRCQSRTTSRRVGNKVICRAGLRQTNHGSILESRLLGLRQQQRRHRAKTHTVANQIDHILNTRLRSRNAQCHQREECS